MMLSVGTAPDADADVYARHAPELVRFATVLAGPSGADDLVASAVLKAFTNPGWTGVQNQRAYLYRAVLNEARQEGRANVRRLRREQLAAAPERSDTPHVRPEVLAAMLESWEATQDEPELARRLLAALQAGDRAGGDRRGRQSAALLVVREEAGYGGMDDVAVDLRVDEHREPVTELARLLDLNRIYLTASTEEERVHLDGDLRAELEAPSA